MRKLNKQEVLDTAWAWLRQQGCKSLTDTGKCAYRGKGGTRCAIGACIPDEVYDSSMESFSIMHLMRTGALSELFTNEVGSVFLRSIQDVHDMQPIEYWEECFNDLARTHNLVPLPA